MKSISTTAVPDARLLSNGRYHTYITAAGTGQSRRHGLVVNHWSGDPVEDCHGQFIYLRDSSSDNAWSIGRQPMPAPAAHYKMSEESAYFSLKQTAYEIHAVLDVVIPPDDDVEFRWLTLTNRSQTPRDIEITGYFEAVLNDQAADIGHPAFSKLFLQTEYTAAEQSIQVRRRARSNEEAWPLLFYALLGSDVTEWETDRLLFIGRNRSAAAPQAVHSMLSGTTGNVLDPCCSLRTVVHLKPGEEHALCFVTGIVDDVNEKSRLIHRYRKPDAIAAAFQAAEVSEQTLRHELGLSHANATRLHSLAAAMHYCDPQLRTHLSSLPGDLNAAELFGRIGLPRDRDLVLVRGDWEDASVQEMLQARRYWDRKGFFTNLLLLSPREGRPRPDGIDDRVVSLPADGFNAEELAVISAAASLVVEGALPTAHCERQTRDNSVSPQDKKLPAPATAVKPPAQISSLTAWNGYGGFSADGREYIIPLERKDGQLHWPPLPWVNAISNENVGFLVSESGAGCTWTRNSQAFRLTSWSNDPVTDPHGEALYLRDEETGQLFSPLPGPVPGHSEATVHHGIGYSRFQTESAGIEQETTLFVPRSDPVKISWIRLTNTTSSAKSVSLTSYQQLVLGSVPEWPSLIMTTVAADGSLRASNLAAGDFHGGITFSAMHVDLDQVEDCGHCCDRLSFLGRFHTPADPAALGSGEKLNRTSGSGLDPCFALQRAFTIRSGQSVDCMVILGEAMTEAEASQLIQKYRTGDAVKNALRELTEFWTGLCDRVQIDTPSSGLNDLVNRWLPYQTISCRIWGRTAFYQSSGAYGFRDQLQDAGNLVLLAPAFARKQILLHAAHQLQEGDVLHWWHPAPIERGLRTRFADDLLWLPYVTGDYIRSTGDVEILDSPVPFLTGNQLHPGEDETYMPVTQSNETADLFEHCCRAIDRSLAVGQHGLPLMGTGDWNDGMNRVGRAGRGESVWLGFFLCRIFDLFIPLCERRDESERVERYRQHRLHLQNALNSTGWDGEWYRRAYFDNGHPLGSHLNEECRIDALAQAWSVLSGVASEERAELALGEMTRQLISEKDGIIRLLTPPFKEMADDPGYIKGYVAGVRENGGQYTHAACWAVMSLAQHGERELATRLLEMLLPSSHSRTAAAADLYKIEPYAVPGDIYGAEPHIGRGGWSWYTGAAGWLYRVAIESILGIRIENGNTLVIAPCISDQWPGYRVTLKLPAWEEHQPAVNCEVVVENPDRSAAEIASATCDGIPLHADGRTVRISLAAAAKRFAPQQIRIVLRSSLAESDVER